MENFQKKLFSPRQWLMCNSPLLSPYFSTSFCLLSAFIFGNEHFRSEWVRACALNATCLLFISISQLESDRWFHRYIHFFTHDCAQCTPGRQADRHILLLYVPLNWEFVFFWNATKSLRIRMVYLCASSEHCSAAAMWKREKKSESWCLNLSTMVSNEHKSHTHMHTLSHILHQFFLPICMLSTRCQWNWIPWHRWIGSFVLSCSSS